MVDSSKSSVAILTIALLAPFAAADWPLTPTPPGNLTAAAGPGAGEVTLAWEAAQSLTGVTGYTVYQVLEDGTLAFVTATDGATLGATVGGLPNAYTVTHVATATDIGGESLPSNAATATTFSAPDAPVGVDATPGANVGEATVTWSAPASDGGLAIAWYNVYRNGGLVGQTAETSWTDTGLELLRDYTYAVSATNAAGEGALSASDCTMGAPWVVDPAVPGCLGLA